MSDDPYAQPGEIVLRSVVNYVARRPNPAEGWGIGTEDYALAALPVIEHTPRAGDVLTLYERGGLIVGFRVNDSPRLPWW